MRRAAADGDWHASILRVFIAGGGCHYWFVSGGTRRQAFCHTQEVGLASRAVAALQDVIKIRVGSLWLWATAVE